MQRQYKHLLFFLLFFSFSFSGFAQDDSWRDKMDGLTYSPRYFGPNAFPYPDVQSGIVRNRWEVEIRGEYQRFSGDKTKDMYARLYIPIANGKVAFEISGVFWEDYETTAEVRDERSAVERTPAVTCHGDAIISTYFQILKSRKWVDIMASVNLKTASGNRISDARYTDAAAYWFDAHIGKELVHNGDETASLRMQIMGGFYCWMTNDKVHRQNDAVIYGAGLTGKYRGFSLTADMLGIHGYKDNGDRPLTIRTKFEYEIKKNIISFRYRHGMEDNLYDSYSLAYIRCF